MTKSITDMAIDSGVGNSDSDFGFSIQRFAAAIKAAHLEELANVEMPEPVMYGTAWGDVVTLDQCREAVAAAVARKDAEIAQINSDWVKCDTAYHALTAERDAAHKKAAEAIAFKWKAEAERDALAKKVEVLRDALTQVTKCDGWDAQKVAKAALEQSR